MLQFLIPGIRSLWNKPKNQIPALDGLRSLAILLVIGTHSTAAFTGMGGTPSFLSQFRLLTGGWVGVDLFFILSGFFIGKQLWQEVAHSGTVNFKQFILRRGLRIWPLYFAVLFITVGFFLVMGKDSRPLWPELFFLSNYFGVHYIGGSWSLATEEQFYIAIPLILLGLSRLTGSLRVMRWVMIGVLAGLPLIRALVVARLGAVDWSDVHRVISTLYEPIHTHSDPLIFGMILSNIMTDSKAREWYSRNPSWAIFIGLSVFGVILRKLNLLVFEYTFLALMFGGLAWYSLQATAQNLLVKVMSWRGFYLISKLSFGMYLMHQYAMDFIGEQTLALLPGTHPALQFAVFSLANLAVAMGSAALGFVVVEHPFLRLRGRLGFGAVH